MQVTFLYELKEGACPKSYGTACARLAGMPEAILARAEELAAALEHGTPTAKGAEGVAEEQEGLRPREAEWLQGVRACLGEPGNVDMEQLKMLQQQAKELEAIEAPLNTRC